MISTFLCSDVYAQYRSVESTLVGFVVDDTATYAYT